MTNIVKLKTLFKRDTTGKIRMWEVEYAETDIAGTAKLSSFGSLATQATSLRKSIIFAKLPNNGSLAPG